MADHSKDPRVIMTLDAGGTSFRFSAMRGGKPVTGTVTLPTHGDDLKQCVANLIEGFSQIRKQCPKPPAAISFAFPGPADYPAGVIICPGNLPALHGVPLGPLLQDKFRIPVFLNNDGELFVYGEAIAGFLPYVNGLLEKAGSSKRFKNLFGVTLGTGFGGGFTHNGQLVSGDNSNASQVWIGRNVLQPEMNAEEGASIRAVRRVYAEKAGISFEQSPEPRVIEQIGVGEVPGNRQAAIEAYRRLGRIVGDTLTGALALVDGLAVIGGGISKGWRLFMPAAMQELNSYYLTPARKKLPKLPEVVFNLEDPAQLKKFLKGEMRTVAVPGSRRKIKFDALQRLGVGISRLGTSEAVAIGAYAFALRKLDA